MSVRLFAGFGLMLTVLIVLFGCSSASDNAYTRTQTPLGVTDSEGPGEAPRDTGADTGGS